ncbi:unnamed protein product [Parnassius apollo]|uniref:(apollo) hypothetical protein n=1 Tax=Parnassius apollo TaxID=110799 RepID=A0A8S3X8M8_PARAO|nr:unnamed protein product [Parnassius apollo]
MGAARSFSLYSKSNIRVSDSFYSETCTEVPLTNSSSELCNKSFIPDDCTGKRTETYWSSRKAFFFDSRFRLPHVSCKKSDGGWRPIFDLRNLNKFVGTKHFHLISHTKVPEFLQPGDWMVKVDISQAYFHLPIAMSHRPLYNQEMLQMTSLPFGLSSAPRLFSAVTCWVAETLRKKGMRVLVYLDDYLIVYQDPSS